MLHIEHDTSSPLIHLLVQSPIGAIFDPENKDGVACHAAELARRGAGSFTRQSLDEHLDSHGISLEFQTSYDNTSLVGCCLARHLDTFIQCIHLLLSQPTFDEKEHQQLIRENIQRLTEMRDEDDYLAFRFFRWLVTNDHPYRRSVLGNAKCIETFSSQESKTFFSQIFAKSDIKIGLAGDIGKADTTRLHSTIQNALSHNATSPLPPVVVQRHRQKRRAFIVDKPERNQCQVVLGHDAPIYGSHDFTAMLIAESVLGGLECSRLNQEIRVKEGWTYSIYTQMDRSKHPGFFSLRMAPANEFIRDALDRTIQVMSEFANEGMNPTEFEFAKNNLLGGLAFSGATARRRMNQNIRLASLGLPADYVDIVARDIKAMSLGDVQSAIKKWIRPEALCLTMVGAASELSPIAESLGFETAVVAYDSY